VEKVENPSIEWHASHIGDKIFLRIQDNGHGMPNAEIDILYNKEGIIVNKSGFGLHLMRDLADVIDCEFEVVSDKNSGTSISVIL